jgi:hypothetical protein
MTHLPMTQDVSRNTPHSVKSSVRGYENPKSARDRLRAAIADPSLFIVFAFCVIGLLVTLNVMFRFPDFGMSVEQLNQFLG